MEPACVRREAMESSLLMGLFGLMVAVVVGLGAFALAKIAAVNASTVDIATNWLPSISSLRDIEYQSSRYRAGEGRHILTNEQADKEAVERDVARRSDNIAKLRKVYEPLISSREERQAYDGFIQHWEAFLKVHQTVFGLSREKRVGEAGALFGSDIVKTYNVVEGDLQKLVDINTTGAETATQNAAANYQSARLMTAVLIAIGVAIALGAMIFVYVGIARPLLALVPGMTRLGEGDFSAVLPGLGRKDEIGAMAAAVERFKIKAKERADAEAAAQAEQDRIAADRRKVDMQRLADEFEAAVGEIVESVPSASTELEASATTLTRTADSTQNLSTKVAAAAEEASTNVQSVSAATEELGILDRRDRASGAGVEPHLRRSGYPGTEDR